MTFDVAKPANDQKIRNGPLDIRNNFTAIVNGDSSFTPAIINLPDQGAPPGALAGSGRIFTDTNSGLYPELHFQDENGGFVQITEDANLGSQTTSVLCQDISLNGGTVAFDKNQFITAWGYFNTAGILQTGKNMVNATSIATGQWRIKTTAIMTTADVGISLTPYIHTSSNPASADILLAPSIAAGVVSFDIETRVRDGNQRNIAFYVLVVGGL